MKKFLTLVCALLFNCVVGAFAGAACDISPVIGAIGANGIATIGGMFSTQSGILRDGVLVEVWTGELIKKLREGLNGSWLDGIPDASSVVENDVIHLVDVGVDPDVLVNNTTYPIEIQELTDGDKAISLDKFQTKVTPVTDDELYAISYDKMARVKEAHSNAINDKKFAKAAHSICAAGIPVIATSGDADASTGRKKLTIANLVAVKAKMDKLGVPAVGRRLVLCPDHINDLLGISESFTRQYNLDPVNGRVARLYGFDIYEYSDTPVYNYDGTKQSLGASEGSGKFHCSFAFYTGRIFKATGSTKMYYSEAKNDPQNQRNLINFRHMFIALPKKADAMVALISGYSSSDVPTITGSELLEVPATQGSKVRTYATSNGAAITAESDADWLTATVGTDGKKVTFAYQAYAHAESGDNPRIGTVTIKIADTDATLEVTVKQAMAES